MKTNKLVKAAQGVLFVVTLTAGFKAYAGLIGDVVGGAGAVASGAATVAVAPVRAVTGRPVAERSEIMYYNTPQSDMPQATTMRLEPGKERLEPGKEAWRADQQRPAVSWQEEQRPSHQVGSQQRLRRQPSHRGGEW